MDTATSPVAGSAASAEPEEAGSAGTLANDASSSVAVADVPLALNVKFVGQVPNPSPAAVLGSKASGEPAMALGAACAFAVRDAMRAARADAGQREVVPDLEVPLTVERIWKGCGVGPERFVLPASLQTSDARGEAPASEV